MLNSEAIRDTIVQKCFIHGVMGKEFKTREGPQVTFLSINLSISTIDNYFYK